MTSSVTMDADALSALPMAAAAEAALAPVSPESETGLPAAAESSDLERDPGGPGASDAALLGWLRRHITALCPPAMLGVVCAGIGIELWRVSPAHWPPPERAGRLLDHLLDTGRLRSFAQLLLLEDATSEAARNRGLTELLPEPTAPTAPPPDARLCQPLAQIETWVGRRAELETLDACLQRKTHVITISGPIGSGKSALIGRWLAERQLTDPARFAEHGLGGVFYWSFTHDPDVPSCLLAAAQYVRGQAAPSGDSIVPGRISCDETASERALAQLLSALRQQSEPLLLVLDGLERFQVGAVPPSGAPTVASPLDEDCALPLGELRDPQLRSLLSELAMLSAPAILLGTVERRVPSLQSWQRGTAHLELAPVAAADGVALLRQLGVGRGPDSDAEQRVAELGGHALTVDLLGRYLSNYYQGDARAVTYGELPSDAPSGELGPMLGRVVRAHLQALSDPHRQLLDLCALLPGPVRVSTLTALLRAAEPERPSSDTPPVQNVNSASFKIPPLIASKLPPSAWLQPSLLARLTELDRFGFARLLTSGPDEQVIDVHPLLRTHLIAEWLQGSGGYVPRLDGDGSDQSDGPGGDVPLLPQGEEALELFEQLIGLLLRAGQSDVAFAVLCHRLGGYLHMVLHLGRPRRFLGILRRLYPALAALAISDGRWQRRYAHLLAWETETLRTLGQLDAALVTAQRQWPIGSGPLPGSLSRQARLHRLAGRLDLALDAATAAQHSAVAASETVIAALELAAVQLLRGDAAMALIHLRDVKARLRDQPTLRRQRWDGLSLGAWLQREHARRALRLGDIARAHKLIEGSRAAAEREGSEVDRAQIDVLLGEVLRRDGQHELAAQTLHRALTFAGRSGDAEVLVSGGLVQARLRLDTNHYESAAAALGTALAMAQEIGLVCHRVDLLVLRGQLSLRRNDLAAAEADARDALAYATAPGCGYMYGEADGLHLLATAILVGQPASPSTRLSEALAHLADELELRERMADPATTEVRWLLRRLRS